MTNKTDCISKDAKQRKFAFSTTLSAFGIAAALTFSPLSAFADAGHEDDPDNHGSCVNHEEMSAEEHDKNHENGAEDCDMDANHDHSDHK